MSIKNENPQKWRLALDMGTDSIGFIVLFLDSNKKFRLGTRIFSNGRNEKGESLNVERRKARLHRRHKERVYKRIVLVFNFFVASGLVKKNQKKQIDSLNPYLCRTEALEEKKLEPLKLVRAISHLGKRRGFKSNRRDSSTEDEKKKKNLLKISVFEKYLSEKEYKTIGQYLGSNDSRSVRFFPDTSEFYPTRKMYEDEFDTIRSMQEKYYPDLDWDRIKELLFYQRPLKPGIKGKCTFYSQYDRAYDALPSSNLFRILKVINYFRKISPNGVESPLEKSEKKVLLKLFNKYKTVSFNTIRKSLKTEFKFNYETNGCDKLKGNFISTDMRKKSHFGEIWDQFSLKSQDSYIRILFEAEEESEIRSCLEDLNLSELQIQNIINYKLPKITTNLSSEFMIDCIDKMSSPEWETFEEAKSQLDIDKDDFIPGSYDYLPYYGEILKRYVAQIVESPNEEESKYGKIGNPTVHIALNQLKKVVNKLIFLYGKPEEIVVELSRDLKNSKEDKKKYHDRQKKNRQENERIKGVLKENGIFHPGHALIVKMKLWEELGADSLNRRCPYCGKPISFSQLISSYNEIEIDHILPFSKTLLDSYDNLVVCHKSCNQYKKNRSPHEAFGNSLDGYDYKSIIERAKINFSRSKASKFLRDALKDYTEENNFVSRQLTDNAYISKVTCQYLSAICPSNKIWTVKAGMIAYLRYKWGLNAILSCSNAKNRFDHRHHAIDALVLSLVDRKLLHKLSTLNIGKIKAFNFEVPEFPLRIKDVMYEIDNMIISIRPQHSRQGKLFKETALSKKYFEEDIFIKEIKEHEVDQIVDVSLRTRFKDYIGKYGFDKGKGRFKKEFIEENGTEVIKCIVPKFVAYKMLCDMKKDHIKRIISKEIKQQIRSEIDVDNCTKEELKKQLASFSAKYNIKRAKIFPDNTKNVAVQIKSAPHKYYLSADYLYVDVWKVPVGKKFSYKGVFCRRIDAYNSESQRKQHTHPCAKKIVRLYKNDILSIYYKKNNSYHFAVVKGFSTTKNKILLQPVYAANDLKSWKENTNQYLVDHSFFRKSPEKSINTLWGKYVVKKMNVPVDGLNKEHYIETNFRDIN